MVPCDARLYLGSVILTGLTSVWYFVLKPTSAENEARYLREQTGTSVPGRPGVVGRRRKITSPE